MAGNGSLETVKGSTNDAKGAISWEVPYAVAVTIEGTAPLLFHRWSVEGVAAQQAARKGSKAKKTDDVATFVYRTSSGEIALPGEYLRGSIITAARFQQDPRSPRKSALDLFKAGIVSLTELASLGVNDWDYLDRRRVVVQRNAVTRMRPAFNAGWKATILLSVMVPEYITPALLHETITLAGRLVGVGDFRPTYGRFQTIAFQRAD